MLRGNKRLLSLSTHSISNIVSAGSWTSSMLGSVRSGVMSFAEEEEEEEVVRWMGR
jgi:hypothetical protein